LIAVVLSLVFGMMGLSTEPVAAQRPSCDTSGTTVQFIGKTCVDSTCTWEYRVCQTGFSLSHWVLGQCECFESYIIEVGYIDAQDNKTIMPKCTGGQTTPCWEFGLDPTTGLFGLKWDNLPRPENECWTFYLTIDEDLADETLDWTSKFAACDPGGGTVTGPACPCGCGQIIAFKYYDVNQNRTYDNEQNGGGSHLGDYELSDWEICLDDDITKNCQLTDEMGFVDFGCLPPGKYTICETPGGSGWINSEPRDGSHCYEITLHAGEQVRRHFGNYEEKPKPAYIRAGKYYDYNHDGECNGPCCPLNNWVFCLDGDCQPTRDYCMLCGGCTDYWEVPPGTYTLCERPRGGWINSEPGVEPPCKEVTVKAGDFICVPFGNWQSPEPTKPVPPTELPTVGIEVYPMNQVALTAPWIALAAGIIAGGRILRRRRSNN